MPKIMSAGRVYYFLESGLGGYKISYVVVIRGKYPNGHVVNISRTALRQRREEPRRKSINVESSAQHSSGRPRHFHQALRLLSQC